jgi:hypothetical protein
MRSALSLLSVLILVCPDWGQEAPRQDTPRPERLQAFDAQRLEVGWTADGWTLRVGDQVLKDFGRRQVEAYEALRLIRDLNLTERGVLGTPTPVLEYWLSNGAAPSGNIRGQRILPFDLATLRVEGDGGQFCLRDAQRILFNFGYAKEEAEQTLAVMRKYRFGRVLILGQAAPTMMVFLRDPSEVLSSPGHRLSGPGIRTEPIKTPQRPGEEKTELSSIQKYVTPSIPALGVGTRPSFSAASPALGGTISPVNTVPGVNDRILRVPFDWRQVILSREPEGWRLHVGSMVLASFGADELLARKALLAFQYYRFNELCLVGPENPRAHFYTINGLPPHGELFGVPMVSLIPEKLTVQKQDSNYVIAQGTDVLLAVGDRPEDARQLLDWIQRQRVERLARLMTPEGQGMMFFLKR